MHQLINEFLLLRINVVVIIFRHLQSWLSRQAFRFGSVSERNQKRMIVRDLVSMTWRRSWIRVEIWRIIAIDFTKRSSKTASRSMRDALLKTERAKPTSKRTSISSESLIFLRFRTKNSLYYQWMIHNPRDLFAKGTYLTQICEDKDKTFRTTR